MKQNKFILNSDYLSIAQTNTSENTVYVGGGTLLPHQHTEQFFDFTVPAQKGAIDRTYINYDNNGWMIGSIMRISLSIELTGIVHVFRTNSNTLRVQFLLENYSGNTNSYPSMTFTIRVASFRPPNVF